MYISFGAEHRVKTLQMCIVAA